MNQHLLNFLLALVVNELFHNVMEIKNIREKVKRLSAYIDKRPYKELPININTRAKSYGLSFVGFFVFVLPLYAIFDIFLDLKGDTAAKAMIGVIVVTYILTAFLIDKYHVEIEQVTKKFKK